MYIPIELHEDNITVYDKSTDRNDSVFNTKDPRHRFMDDPLNVNDKDYKKPDREQYIFSTMGIGLNTMYSNNMITPIRTKSTLNGYKMYNIIGKYINKKHIDNGVYIVDYYNIYNNGSTEIDNVIRYYLNTCNIPYDQDTVTNIVDTVMHKDGRVIPTEIQIRLITYVPESTINDFNYVYIPTSDVVICKGVIDNRVVHPNSKNYRSNVNHIKSYNTNSVIIEIVDNDSGNPYFIKIGNDVVRLYPTRDLTQSNSCKSTLYKNGAKIVTTECKLHEMASMLGIHKSKEGAISDGNIDKIAENNKLKLESSKLQLEYTKILHDKEKMEHDREKMKHEKEKLLIERELLIEKLSHERIINEQKVTMSELDIAKRYRDFEITYRESIVKLNIAKANHILDVRLANAKYKLEEDKYRYEFGMKGITLVSNIVKKFT